MADLGAGAIFGAINTAFKFSEFAIELAEVGSENNVFVRTIQRVRLDLNEAERLLRVPAIRASLENNPQKSFWIQQAIHSTKSALNDIGLFVERVRSDQDRDETVSFINRVRWVLNDHGKLENRRSELATCHQSLATVLSTLHPVEMLASFSPTVASPVMPPPPTYESVSQVSDFTSPYNRKKRRMKVVEPEVKEVNEILEPVADPAPQEIPQVIERSAVVPPPSEILNVPETARSVVQRSLTSSGISSRVETTRNTAGISNPQQYPNVESGVAVGTSSETCERPRAVSCTGTNLLGPINSWDMWKDYLEQPSFQAPVSSTEPLNSRAVNSVLVEVPRFSAPVSAISPSTMSYELDETPRPSIAQITNRNSLSHAPPIDQSAFPLEIEGLRITKRPPAQPVAPKYQTRPMSTAPIDSYGTRGLERPAIRRYTSFQPSNPPSELMVDPTPYRAYSKPHIPQLRPGIEQRETCPPPPAPRVLPYPTYLPERPMQDPVEQVPQPFCPYPTDAVSMPTELEYRSPPRRATSPALSFVSEISAMESNSSGNQVSSHMHPALLRPGCQISRGAVSQSRRRRAMMEAALGVIGEK
ncbi:hypothetical protein IFR04_015530 [Cadophora malorum]|uniref:Uncharacterized protein n=1 Tax=Cadophora malorum TaxID=108018 RepID=A0A8H7W586_9HELO|nr:hypothetical protein IFR04_015530 [Cadophora malorum]